MKKKMLKIFCEIVYVIVAHLKQKLNCGQKEVVENTEKN